MQMPCFTFIIYVDDILLTRNDSTAIEKIIKHLHDIFNMKELDHLSTFLGLRATPHHKGIPLDQTSYALQILEKAKMTS